MMDLMRRTLQVCPPGPGFPLKRACFIGPLEDVFPVDVTQLDLGHEFRLHLVNAEADHQVRDHFGFLVGVSNDFDGAVDVQQYLLKALQKVQFVFFLVNSQKTRRLTHSVRQAVHSSRISRTPMTRGMPAMRILKLHEKLSISVVCLNSFAISLSGSSAFEVDRQLQPFKVGFVAHVGDLTRLAVLTRSATLSMTASAVVVYGISKISMRFSF